MLECDFFKLQCGNKLARGARAHQHINTAGVELQAPLRRPRIHGHLMKLRQVLSRDSVESLVYWSAQFQAHLAVQTALSFRKHPFVSRMYRPG